MDLEIGRVRTTEVLNSSPKCTYSTYTGPQKIISLREEDDNLNSSSEDSEIVGAETRIIKSIYDDDKAALMIQSKQLSNTSSKPFVNRSIVSKLLQVCCLLDSVDCATALLGGELGTVPLVNEADETGKSALHTAAESHAARCVELLLRKRARTDLRTKDGSAQLALELSLSSPRMDVIWNPDDCSIEELVVLLGEKDLTTIRLLSEKTKEAADVACKKAVEGHIVALATLLIVAAGKINESVLEFRDADSGSKEKTTIYECVIREALSASSVKTAKLTSSSQSADARKRKLLLSEIELLQLFGVVSQSRCTDNKVKPPAPLVRAVQVGDEAVVMLLLKTGIDINDIDAEGNSALHWSLKASRAPCLQELKILLLLLKHGARVNQKDKLGLTALHMAAGNGNSQALQILLLEDPDGINYKTEMKETPLFFAVKNDHMDCAELLVRWGANTEVFNLRQRPVDLAKSQDMRFMLNPTNISLMNRTLPVQKKHTTWLQGDEVFLDACEKLLTMTDGETTSERFCSSSMTECKYFNSPQGCARGEKCFYSHCVEEHPQVKQGTHQNHYPSAMELKRKIFVGGLPPVVNSDLLRKFFEEHFGSVEDAIVLVNQAGDTIQSRGFGFVTFKDEKSVSTAVQAHYVTIMDKEVEIKSVIPKWLLVNVSPKLSPRSQDGQEKNDKCQPQAQVSSDYKIMEENKPLQNSRVNKLLPDQITKCSINEAQAHANTAFENHQRIPNWLRIFKMWLPSFLQELSEHPREGEYALSSLKGDFRAKFGLELDHASLGYSKLSDFIKCFSDLCCIVKRGLANHMILLPKHSPRPQQQHLCHMPTNPQTASSAKSIDDQCDHISGSSKNVGPRYSHIEKENTSSGFSDVNSLLRSTKPNVNQRFLQFLKRDPLFHTRPWLQREYNNAGKGNDIVELGRCTDRVEENHVRHLQRHLVLEDFARRRNNQSVYFLREFDFYRNYKADVTERRCFACNQSKALWANFPCQHLLWCSNCKMQALLVAGSFAHKCVVCDVEVQRIYLRPCNDQSQLECEYFSHYEEFPPFDPTHIRSPSKKKNTRTVGI